MFLDFLRKFKTKINRSCVFCGGCEGDIKEITMYGCYLDSIIEYHNECLKKVCADPEKYGNLMTDHALEIVNYIEREKLYQEKKNNKLKESRFKLKKFIDTNNLG